MGTMTFKLPARLPKDAHAALRRATVAGGQPSTPYPTQVIVHEDEMVVSRPVDESGSLLTPWDVESAGRVMVSTATLMERLKPYDLALELARGKLNQVRSQEADWLSGGLNMPESLPRLIKETTHTFSQAVSLAPDPRAADYALQALKQSVAAGEQLVAAYTTQVFSVRHQRQNQLDTTFACRVAPGALTSEQKSLFSHAFNAMAVPFLWAEIEPEEESFRWQPYDDLITSAAELNLPLVGGPLFDFSGLGLPAWLWEKEVDISGMYAYLSDFAERVLERYRGTIKTWQVTSASNMAGVIARGDDELLWLTVKLAEFVKRMDSGLEVIVGITQPWGDYLGRQEAGQSPFVFADNLLRTGLKLAALELEVIMGIDTRGSYCRDILDLSRLLDMYALLGIPLQVTLGYPSSSSADALADSEQKPGAGFWRTGYSPEVQSEWAAAFAQLGVCKPFVRSVHWTHFADAYPHQLPHCGLLDSQGKAKPALEKLAALRAEHLK